MELSPSIKVRRKASLLVVNIHVVLLQNTESQNKEILQVQKFFKEQFKKREEVAVTQKHMYL